MGRSFIRRRFAILLLSVLSLGQAGCYYAQAAAGQWQVLRKSERIDELLVAEDTSAELAARLRLVQEARKFSITELGLPDNGSYRSYTDIERDFVVWNVFAAPEFSLQPRQWCFPIAGCVSYRGYFSRDAAYREAERLSKRGYDVAVGGVSAYSTLGNFNDPVLSSMMHWDDIQLVGTLFHELAHQVLYVKDDSGFNESFATAVEEFGLERWLHAAGRPGDMQVYRQRRELRNQLMALVDAAREDLKAYYVASHSDTDKRRLKQARLLALRRDIDAQLQRIGRSAGDWPGGDLNNARLASMALYEGWLPAFRSLLLECEQELACFFLRAEQLGRLDKVARDAHLAVLARR
ncbi:MAG: aminopeptidase [Woeseiaceae bacterium]